MEEREQAAVDALFGEALADAHRYLVAPERHR